MKTFLVIVLFAVLVNSSQSAAASDDKLWQSCTGAGNMRMDSLQSCVMEFLPLCYDQRHLRSMERGGDYLALSVCDRVLKYATQECLEKKSQLFCCKVEKMKSRRKDMKISFYDRCMSLYRGMNENKCKVWTDSWRESYCSSVGNDNVPVVAPFVSLPRPVRPFVGQEEPVVSSTDSKTPPTVQVVSFVDPAAILLETPLVSTPAPIVPFETPLDPTPAPTVPFETPLIPTPAPTGSIETPLVPTPAPTAPFETTLDPTPAPTVPVETPLIPTPAPTDSFETPLVPTPAPTVSFETPSVPTPAPTVLFENPAVPTPAPTSSVETPMEPTSLDEPDVKLRL